MMMRNETLYLGPGQPPIVIRTNDLVDHCNFIQVGWSLLRNLTRLTYNHLVQIEDGAHDFWFCNNYLEMKPAKDSWGAACIQYSTD
jgi:hypothetical protein